MYEKIFGLQHRVTVLRLYKTILRLHRSLPDELRELGNQYVREEFRRHKTAEPQYVTNFMVEWSVSVGGELQWPLDESNIRRRYDVSLFFIVVYLR